MSLVAGILLAIPAVILADSVEGESIPFGQVRAGAVISRELAISNGADVPLIVKDINASCSYLRVVGFDRSILPGKKGTIAVEYRPITVGETNVELLVLTDRHAEPLITFRWKGEILPADRKASEESQQYSTLFISPAELAAGGAEAKHLLVDVRKSEQFNAIHVETSVNWPHELLGSLLTAQKQHVVIIGRGEDDNELAKEALALRSAGASSVKVLRGGIRAWAMAKLPVRGSNTTSPSSAIIDPGTLFASPDDDWLVLNLAGKTSVPASERIPGSLELPFDAGEEKAVADTISKALPLRPTASKILIVSRDGGQYEAFERNFPPGLELPVFYLSGGSVAYRQFIGMQQAERASRQIRLATSATTGNNQMPSGGAVRVSTNGCATCPPKKGAVR